MKSTQGPTDKEQAERAQLDEALAESRAEAAEAPPQPNGTRTPRLVRALQDRRDRSGMGFYDEYVQTAKDEPYGQPRKPKLDDLRTASFGPGDTGRWNRVRRNGPEAEAPINGYAERATTVEGQTTAPRAPQPTSRGNVPAVLTVNDSVFTLLSEQVKELRQQKAELQSIITEQEEKISELIGLVHQLMSQPGGDVLDQTAAPPHGHESDDR